MEMEKFQCIVVLISILALISCEGNNPHYQYTDGNLTRSTPELFRNIPTDSLIAKVTIGGNEATYYGRDYPDNEWNIELQLDENQRYELMVAWYANEHLLMEERGEIVTQTAGSAITPDLDFASGGADRFDNDCDGKSNLDEINAGDDPGLTRTTPCQEPPLLEDPAAELAVWLANNFKNYAASGVSNRISSIEQHIRIRKNHPTARSFYRLRIKANGDIIQTDGSAKTAVATLQVVKDPSAESFATFFIAQAINFQPAEVEGISCNATGSEPGHYCRIPYDVQKDRWYTLRLVESATSSWWQGWIVDQESGEAVLIATMQTPEQTNWRSHSTGLGLSNSVTALECSQGLGEVSMRYSEALINQASKIFSEKLVPAECYSLGAQSSGSAWRNGVRIVNGEIQYSLAAGAE